MASLQGMAADPAEGSCKDTAELYGSVANDERGSPSGMQTSNDRKHGVLHSTIAALSKDFCSAEGLPPSKGTLRRRKKVTQLREAAS